MNIAYLTEIFFKLPYQTECERVLCCLEHSWHSGLPLSHGFFINQPPDFIRWPSGEQSQKTAARFSFQFAAKNAHRFRRGFSMESGKWPVGWWWAADTQSFGRSFANLVLTVQLLLVLSFNCRLHWNFAYQVQGLEMLAWTGKFKLCLVNILWYT